MKKMLSCLLCALLLLHISAVSATAVSDTEVINALKRCDPHIDISARAIPVAEIAQVMARWLYGDPSLFHVAPTFSYRYDADGRVISLSPTYTLTGEALVAAYAIYEAALDALCEGIDPALNDADKALYLHDRLAAGYTYDNTQKNRDTYTFFRDGTGVCQAYALAFAAAAQRLGLSVDVVTSDAMDHAWNHVCVDGTWYHVDVTHDDPSREDSLTVLHSRFLRSDAGMAALGYRDYTCAGAHACVSSRFESSAREGVWAAYHTVPLRVGNVWCFVGEDDTLHPFATAEGPVAFPIGDVSGDGVAAPDDLLILRRDADTPPADALLHRLREGILDTAILQRNPTKNN